MIKYILEMLIELVNNYGANILDYIFQFLITFLGVLLAIFLTWAVNNNYKKRKAKRFVKYLEKELRENLVRLKEVIESCSKEEGLYKNGNNPDSRDFFFLLSKRVTFLSNSVFELFYKDDLVYIFDNDFSEKLFELYGQINFLKSWTLLPSESIDRLYEEKKDVPKEIGVILVIKVSDIVKEIISTSEYLIKFVNNK